MTSKVTALTAVGAGAISFLSPCVLPLIPGYISFIAGVHLSEIKHADHKSQVFHKTIYNSLSFILGFSTAFVLLGAGAVLFGTRLLFWRIYFQKVAGVVLVIFALHTMGILKINFLNYEKRFHVDKKPKGIMGAFFVGLAFALGWTPCIGPILGAILVYAGTQKGVWDGVLLLLSYSLGLGIPFFLTALSINSALHFFERVQKHFRLIENISGILLLVFGVLIFTDNLQSISFF